MPTSNLAVCPAVLALIAETQRGLDRPVAILDVGAGFGKYGLLIREYVNGLAGGAVSLLDAIEAEPRYLERFPWLERIYGNVIEADVTVLTREELAVYDIVVMADVIEHLDKDVALELLARIDGYVVISTPRDYFQNPEHLEYPFESHRSHWTVEDFGPRVDRTNQVIEDELGGIVVRLGARYA